MRVGSLIRLRSYDYSDDINASHFFTNVNDGGRLRAGSLGVITQVPDENDGHRELTVYFNESGERSVRVGLICVVVE